MLINFEPFFGNSSTEEAICLFVVKKYSFKEFSLACYPRACKNQIRKMKHLGYKKSIILAKKAIKKNCLDWENYECDCNW